MNGPCEVAYPCIQLSTGGQRPKSMAPYDVYYMVPSAARFFRFPEWPPLDWYYPGAILDAQGRLFSVKQLAGWRAPPPWARWLNYLFGLDALIFFVVYGSQLKLVLSEPRQLNLDDAKRFVSLIVFGNEANALLGDDRDVYDRTNQRLDACTSHRELIDFVHWFQMSDGGLP